MFNKPILGKKNQVLERKKLALGGIWLCRWKILIISLVTIVKLPWDAMKKLAVQTSLFRRNLKTLSK